MCVQQVGCLVHRGGGGISGVQQEDILSTFGDVQFSRFTRSDYN